MQLFSKREIILVSIDLLLLSFALPGFTILRVEIDSLKESASVPAIVKTETEPSAPVQNPIAIATIPQSPPSIEPIEKISHTYESDPFLDEVRRRTQEDPEATMAWLQSLPHGPDQLRGMHEAVDLWAATDSPSALYWLESNAQGFARLETLNSGMEVWAKQDPIAAAEWIAGMANDGSKVAAAKALASNWAMNNSNEASQWVNSLPVGPLRNEVAQALVESWITTEPEQAAVWALSEAEFNGNVDLLHLSIKKYTATAPEQAELFLRSLTEAYEAPEAIETYVRARALNNPQETMDWQIYLAPQDPLNQPDNTRIIMQEWSRTDSVAASGWLNEQSPGPRRDAAIIGFGDTMLAYEPEAATTWANFISEPATRIKQLKFSLHTWSQAKPNEALEWVETADIDPNLRDTLATEIGAK